MHRSILTILCASLGILVFLGGCASKLATRKDLSVLMPGVSRAVVIDELGTPVSTTTNREGRQVDIFRFVQGTRQSNKPPRPVESERAETTEVLALLDQFGQSPTKLLTGKKLTIQVNYDADERVQTIVLLRME